MHEKNLLPISESDAKIRDGPLTANIKLFGEWHHYVHGTVGYPTAVAVPGGRAVKSEEGILIQRILFCPERLPQIVHMLQQQVVFNELFTSCFNANSIQQHIPHDESSRVVEIMTEAPWMLSLTFLHPKRDLFICLEIKVEEGGQLNPNLHLPSEFEASSSSSSSCGGCSNEFIRAILHLTHSVPITIHNILLSLTN